MGVVPFGRVLGRRRADDGAEHVHGRAVLAHLLEDLAQERRERPVLGELRLEVAQLRLARKVAVQEEVRDLLVLGLGGELLDGVSAVNEAVVFDLADGRGGGDDALEAAGGASSGLLLGGHESSVAQAPG